MNHFLYLRLLSKLATFVLLGFTASSAFANTYFTDFENIGGFIQNGGAVTDFSVGPAQFTLGMSGVAGIRELYNTGTHAWMVKGGEMGIIQFVPGNYDVSFYAKAFSGSTGATVINAFDQSNAIVGSLTLDPSNPFTRFNVSGLISRIEFINNDSVNTRMNALDDFSVTAVPLPSAVWLFGSALLGFSSVFRVRKVSV